MTFNSDVYAKVRDTVQKKLGRQSVNFIERLHIS